MCLKNSEQRKHILMSNYSAETYAYFYPSTIECKEKQDRAVQHGMTLVNEISLASNTEPQFSGHDQPRRYSLDAGMNTEWDDANIDVMTAHVSLALEAGLAGFIFDTYVGGKKGRVAIESGQPLDIFASSSLSDEIGFTVMLSLSGPRAVLPVPIDPAKRERYMQRTFDYSKTTAQAIVRRAATFWEYDSYKKIGDRPWMAICFNDVNPPWYAQEDAQLTVPEIVEHIKDFSDREYDVEPYITAVCMNPGDVTQLDGCGVDAYTGYALLPDFTKDGPPIQDHETRLDEVVRQWEYMRSNSENGIFLPPAVVGWDATPRAEAGYKLEEMKGVHPFSPILVGSTPEVFRNTLSLQRRFLEDFIPEDEQVAIVSSWNEVSEGSTILPRLLDDGTVDKSYIETTRSFIDDNR